MQKCKIIKISGESLLTKPEFHHISFRAVHSVKNFSIASISNQFFRTKSLSFSCKPKIIFLRSTWDTIFQKTPHKRYEWSAFFVWLFCFSFKRSVVTQNENKFSSEPYLGGSFVKNTFVNVWKETRLLNNCFKK